MKKLTYEKWESKFYDVPFIKPNFDLLESMGVGVETVSWSQDTEEGKTKYVRVFHFGGWYEILENGNHYLLLGNNDWLGKEEETIKTIKKELYDWASTELSNFGE
jgi:hypothetical protein